MNFQFVSDLHADLYKSLTSAVKHNNGFFKSAKQAKFIDWNFAVCRWSFDNKRPLTLEECAQAKTFFNVDVTPDQKLYSVDASVRWVDYGSRSYRRCGWMFVTDDFGVVRKYKLAFTYDDKHGSSGVNAAKTVLEFSRDESVAKPIFEAEAPKPEAPVSEFLGIEGQRMNFEAKVVKVINLGPSRFAYNQSSYLTIMVDEKGNLIKYFNYLADEGETIKFKAGVKAHQVYEGKKSTLISRARMI